MSMPHSSPLLAALAAFGLVALIPPIRASAPPKPNVLFISVDDLRDWVGYLGRNPQVRTPNIDRLAQMGVSFTRSYCAAPVCNPSRTALMSGLRPGTTGVYRNETDWRPTLNEELMLTTTFRRAGYYVAGAGKIYHRIFERPGEWDDYMGTLPRLAADAPSPNLAKVSNGQSDGVGIIKFAPLDRHDEDLMDWRITDYAIEQLSRKHDRPFLLSVGLLFPHLPWNVPRKWFDLFPVDQIALPPYLEDDLADLPPTGLRMANPQGDHSPMLKSGRWKEAVQAYLAAIAYADMNIGRLLDALEQSAYRDNTIICLWGDHGWHLGEKHHWRKETLWEEGTRTPLLWVVPGLTRAGSVCERPVDLMSVYPTLTDLCGIPTPAHVEGVSIRELLADPQTEWALPAITTHLFNNHAVRTERWRYIRYDNGDEELYDEATDPNEWANLAPDRRYDHVKADLTKWLPRKNLPSPVNPVPAAQPRGSKVQNPRSDSPPL